jgi:hypothetical protein
VTCLLNRQKKDAGQAGMTQILPEIKLMTCQPEILELLSATRVVIAACPRSFLYHRGT